MRVSSTSDLITQSGEVGTEKGLLSLSRCSRSKLALLSGPALEVVSYAA